MIQSPSGIGLSGRVYKDELAAVRRTVKDWPSYARECGIEPGGSEAIDRIINRKG